MPTDDSDLLRDSSNPLTEAIFEAAEDLEKGRPLGAAPDPLAAAAPAPPLSETPPPAESPAPVETPTTPAEAPAAVTEAPAEPEEEKGPSFWSRLAEASPYTVMLAVSLAALVVGIALLMLELQSYGWEFKAPGGAG